MPSFSTEVPHSLGQDAARQKLERFLDHVSQKYKGQIGDMDGGWEDNILNFPFATFGIKVSGKMVVDADKVTLDGELPFSAMMFKGKIVGGIKDALQKELNS